MGVKFPLNLKERGLHSVMECSSRFYYTLFLNSTE